MALVLLSLAARPAAADDRTAEALRRAGLNRSRPQLLRLSSARTLDVDLGDRRVHLRLEPSALRAPGFRVLVETAPGRLVEVTAPPAASWRGTIDGIPGAVVGGTIRDGRMRLALALPEGRTFYVQPVDDLAAAGDPTAHVVYEAADAEGEVAACATSEASDPVPDAPRDPGASATSGTPMRVAELAFDADFEFFTANGASVDSTIADIENVASAVNAVFERDVLITHQITAILVRSTVEDPYTATTPQTLLGQFRDHWLAAHGDVARDVAHLMTGNPLDGSGGIAFLGSICSPTRGYGLSRSRFTTVLSHRCALVAHELGHGWNASHCDGDSPCHIMCSIINRCDGVGLPNFEPAGIAAIDSYAASRTCLGTATLAVDDRPPSRLELAPAAPTPFTDQTQLRFRLERAERVELAVYDVAGHRVARLLDGVREAGWHHVTWDARDARGHRVRSGLYYVRLRAGDAARSRALVLLP
ncbi:MAG TPA: zinc-dependent metalloprotease family protein [Candidatus Binatia bacterium]|nr:zinc-dependent metalloprotease family protein [Candidatus Binatia bacterium]